MRYAWLFILSVLCLPSSLPAGERLRIVAFNAECLAPPGERVKLERFRWDAARRQHFERVASIIEALEPDILNLSEATSAESLRLLVQILHEKGLNNYRGYHVENSDTFTGFDVALVARHAPDLIDNKPIRHFFSPAGDMQYRETYIAKDPSGTVRERTTSISRNAMYFFTIGGHRLGFFGLHLKAAPDDPPSNAQRTAEAAVAQRIIRDEIVSRGYLPIVLGDLNDYDPDVADRDESRSPQTDVLARLKDFDAKRPEAELVNAAERIARQADRYTNHWDRNENLAVDPGDVFTMLDHVLVAREIAPAIRKAFIFHASDHRTSDHWPVVVDLELPAAAAP